MNPSQAEFTCSWVRTLLPNSMLHALVSRGRAQLPGTSEGITLYEVALRLRPQVFAALFKPPGIGEQFLSELLTGNKDDGILLVPDNQALNLTFKEPCDGDDCEGSESY